MRRLTEELMAVDDWGELAVAVHLVVDPILSEIGASEIVPATARSTVIR